MIRRSSRRMGRTWSARMPTRRARILDVAMAIFLRPSSSKNSRLRRSLVRVFSRALMRKGRRRIMIWNHLTKGTMASLSAERPKMQISVCLPSVEIAAPPPSKRPPAKAVSKRTSPYLLKSSSAESRTLLAISSVLSMSSAASSAASLTTATTASAKDCGSCGTTILRFRVLMRTPL